MYRLSTGFYYLHKSSVLQMPQMHYQDKAKHAFPDAFPLNSLFSTSLSVGRVGDCIVVAEGHCLLLSFILLHAINVQPHLYGTPHISPFEETRPFLSLRSCRCQRGLSDSCNHSRKTPQMSRIQLMVVSNKKDSPSGCYPNCT